MNDERTGAEAEHDFWERVGVNPGASDDHVGPDEWVWNALGWGVAPVDKPLTITAGQARMLGLGIEGGGVWL